MNSVPLPMWADPTIEDGGHFPPADAETQEMTQAAMTQPEEEQQSSEDSGSTSTEEAAWGRLICLSPVPGIHELKQRQVVMGRTTNGAAQVQIDDGRIR